MKAYMQVYDSPKRSLIEWDGNSFLPRCTFLVHNKTDGMFVNIDGLQENRGFFVYPPLLITIRIKGAEFSHPVIFASVSNRMYAMEFMGKKKFLLI